MKRVLSLLVATMMIIGMFGGIFVAESVKAVEDDEAKNVVMIVNEFNRVGYDRYGRPLDNGRSTEYEGVSVNNGRFVADPSFVGYPTYDALSGIFFPWQDAGEELWGSPQYKMPNCVEAIQDPGAGPITAAVNTLSDEEWSVLPYLYTEAYLTVKAEGGESQLYDKRYIVMDELGQVWIDPDGRFHDCRYWEPANPESEYYRSIQIFSGDGTTDWNDCDTNPKMIVDPSGDNNTQGPYIMNSAYNPMDIEYPVPKYHERIHYWWYDEEKEIDRVWQLGLADQTDYLRKGAVCADGYHTSSGIVSGAYGTTPGGYYPGKPVLWNTQISDDETIRWNPNDANIMGNDWDVGLQLATFSGGEFLIDVDGDGTYTYGEPIYSDVDASGTFNERDLRLIAWTITWGGQSFNFRKGTLVGPTDEDYQWQLAHNYPIVDLSTVPGLKHSAAGGVSFYDQVYDDVDDDNMVSYNDVRLTHINGRVTGMGASAGGYFAGDAFIMLETLRTSCSFKYNIHVQSDLWQVMQEDTYEAVEMYPSMTAAQFTSPNGDIVRMSQLVNKATALDVNGVNFYVPTTTFYNVALLYREYIGLQLFLDNGVDNNRAEGGECFQLSLADDHENFKAGELFIGCQDVETAMDYELELTEFNNEFLYFETSYDMTNPPAVLDGVQYGCGEPFYRDIKKLPLNPAIPFQPDPYQAGFNPGVVNQGDQRMIDIEVYSNVAPDDAGTMVSYPAGSFVVAGDLDVGRPLIKMDPGLAYFDEPNGCLAPNAMYDVGELIYFDPALAAGLRATQMVAWDDVGVHPWGTEDFDPTPYNDPATGLPAQRWDTARHGGNTQARVNPGENNNGGGSYGMSGWMGGTVPSGGMDWYYQQCGGLSTQSPYTGNFGRDVIIHNAGPATAGSQYGYYYDYGSYGYGYVYNYTYHSYCGDLLAVENDVFLGDWRLHIYEDTAYSPNQYNYATVYGTYTVTYYDRTTGYPYPPGVTRPVYGRFYLRDYIYYSSSHSAALVWYRGLDSNLEDVCDNVGGIWDNYQFNYEVMCSDNRYYTTYYDKVVGMGCVYMDHAGNGYGQQYFHSEQPRSYYGWNAGSNWSAMHFLRWEASTHPEGGGPYSRAHSLARFNAPQIGDLMAFDTVHEVDTTVFAGFWTIETEFWPAEIQVNLTGTPNGYGSIGFNHKAYYNYGGAGYYYGYTVDAYFDNAKAYHIDIVPSAGDRRRLLEGGHHIGMNEYVYRLDDANYNTSSTAASNLKPFSYFYPCGSKLAAGEIYDVKSKVSMISMGKCGDPRFMDIPVLPGEVTLNVNVDGKPLNPEDKFHLKVEQTSDIQVSVDPPPQPGEKYVVKLNGVFQEGIPAKEAYTDYIQTREANTFTEFCDGLIPEFELDKDLFTSTMLYYTYSNEISLPFDFPLYDHTFAAGSPLYISTSGLLAFDIPNVNDYPNPGTTPSTYYWFGYRYGTSYRDYTIVPLGIYQSYGYAPRSGNTPNDNLQIFYCQPTAEELKVRWMGYQYYTTDPNVPPTLNYSCTLKSDGTVRFSYGENYNPNGYTWYNGVCGISGDISGSAPDYDQFVEGYYHGLNIQSYDYAEDLVFSRFEFPADPGRAGGGTVDDNYIIAENVETAHSNDIGGAHYKVVNLTAENPVEHITYTPYRGSVQEDGSCDPLRIEVFLERGGVAYPTPVDSMVEGLREERPYVEYEDIDLGLYNYNIYDPYWVVRPWTNKMYEGRYRGDHTPRPIPSTSGMISSTCALDNQYDCYGKFDMIVEPEWIDIKYAGSGNTCISPVDQRFPNLVLTVWDSDNPNDVNDPAGMNFSTVALQSGIRGKMIANVNAHGAGISYMCTAQSPDEPNERYIIQVNDDGTYTYWKWYEAGEDRPGAAMGALDPTDWLYSWRYPVGGVWGDIGRSSIYSSRQPWTDTDGWLQTVWGGDFTTELDDYDCSIDKGTCDVCHLGSGFPSLGDITLYDRMGRFNNLISDSEPPFYAQNTNPGRFGTIATFGIPTMVTNWDSTSDGGEIYIPVQPKNTSTDLKIRVYLANTIYDYNSVISSWSFDNSHPTFHPPYFVYDDSPGIDYCGTFTVDVQPADILNFGEFNLVDHALQFSEADYTSGAEPLAPMDRPSPQLRHWYNPICGNYKEDMRAYPGGQSHTARAIGSEREGGFNAYPAINHELFNKLGTEFYPLTDYGLYFTLVSPTSVGDGRNYTSYTDWDQYTFDPNGRIPRYYPTLNFRLIETIEVTGPFMTPAHYYRPNILGSSSQSSGYVEERLVSEYRYNGVENVPIRYDRTGYIKIDRRNSQYYEMYNEFDFTRLVSPGYRDDFHSVLGDALPTNKYLERSRDLVYRPDDPGIYHSIPGIENNHVFAIDEIIPIQPGNIEIKVTLTDGTVKIFQDCCTKPISDGIDVHALGISLDNADVEERGGIYVDETTTLEVRVTEDEKPAITSTDFNEWEYRECNDAVVFAWQDTGYFDPQQNIWIGAGDGWITNPPKNSTVYQQGTQYLPEDDFDEDGKVSYASHETEILGCYDIATNTWTGAFIDARTFQRNDGLYKLEVTPDRVGFDFGGFGPTGDPLPPGYKDHVVGFDETLPVWIVAYKYGDDSGDRSFRPLYDSIPDSIGSMSHEVYLAGTRAFEVFPQEDLNMTYGPEPLTAGMTPELQNPESPLHFTFTDDSGNPVDFSQGVEDGFGNAFVKDKDIAMHCFVDPHLDNQYYYGIDAKLPQYYWTRTDLHNFDGTPVCNSMMYSQPDYPFSPITFEAVRDSNGDLTGRYNFLGFVANDQGEFEVYAYTPDRKHRAKTTVKVIQPKVHYTFKNEKGDEFEQNDDVDFMMTANDARLYEITATCWDGQGALIKGTAKEVSVCSGSGSDTARFTPYITRPKNWDYQTISNPSDMINFGTSAHYGTGTDILRGSSDKMFLMSEGGRYYPYMGIDLSNDGSIDPMHSVNAEVFRFRAMLPYQQASYALYDSTRYTNWSEIVRLSANIFLLGYNFRPLVHYNTTNTRYDDFSFVTEDSWDVIPYNNTGWGWGAIYNNPYEGSYIFADLDLDGRLTFSDSLSFNENGEVSFYFWADDVSKVGGLIGNNNLSNERDFSDVVGFPGWYSKFDPNYTFYRYIARKSYAGHWYGTMDHSFKLDWEAMPDRNACSKEPTITLYDPETGEELDTGLLEGDADAAQEAIIGEGTDKDVMNKIFGHFGYIDRLIDEEEYDFTYGVRNHFIVKVKPASDGDMGVCGSRDRTNWLAENDKYVEEGSVITVSDYGVQPAWAANQYEYHIKGVLGYSDENATAETIMYWTPTGTGNNVASLNITREYNFGERMHNNRTVVEEYEYDQTLHLSGVEWLDVVTGLEIEATPYNGILKLGQPDSVSVVVREASTDYLVEGAEVTFKSVDGEIELSATTNALGEALFQNVTPTSQSKVIVEATADGYTSGDSVLYVDLDLTPPSIDVDEFVAITNSSSLTLTGKVSKGAELTVAKKDAKVAADGKWESAVTLTEGENLITLHAVGSNGVEAAVTVTVNLDTTNPKILLPTQADIDALDIMGDDEEIFLIGRVTPGSQVEITIDQDGNQRTVPVTVANDTWKTQKFEVKAGSELIVTVKATDAAGNEHSEIGEYNIIGKHVVVLGIRNSVPVVNGVPAAVIQPPELDAQNNIMVPIKDLEVLFDGMAVNATNNTATVSYNGLSATATVGSPNYQVNGNTATFAPAAMTGNKLMVPIGFLQQVLELSGADVSINVNGTVITITMIGG